METSRSLWLYSKTCPKWPPLGANKSGLCRQVVSVHRYNTLKQCETYNERGDRKEKITKIISNVLNVKELKWVLLPAWALLRLPSNFCQGTSQKKAVSERDTVSPRRENRPMVHENPVAGRARQVVAIRSAVSIWNCPCTKKRSLEAGGRLSQVLLCLMCW